MLYRDAGARKPSLRLCTRLALGLLPVWGAPRLGRVAWPPGGRSLARSQRQVLACCFSRRQSRTISAQATLSIVRVTVTEDSFEVLLSRWEKVLGLLGDIKVARGERFVPDHQVAPISHHPRHECPSYR
jgi:hypothetical protein